MNRLKHLFLVLLLVLQALLVLIFILVPGYARESADETIKIGEIDPLSGKLAKHGIEIHEGILMAVEEINARGGISGKKVELVTRDDQSLPEVAYTIVQELSQRKNVLAITGGYVDTLVSVISTAALKNKIPYVAAASIQEELSKTNNPYFFRISKLSGFLNPITGFLLENIKPRRIGILYASTPGATEFASKLTSSMVNHGIEVPFKEKFKPGLSDFTPLIIKMTRYDLDFIVSGGFLPDHLLLIRQIKQNGYPLKGYLGPWGIAYPSFISQMKDEANLLFSTCAWNPEITLPGTEEQSKKFVEHFKNRFGKIPNTTNMHGYTAAMVILDALKRIDVNHKDAKEHLRDAIAATDILLPMEHVVFDKNGDPLHYKHVVVQIQEGRIVPVYPPARAKAKPIYPMTTVN